MEGGEHSEREEKEGGKRRDSKSETGRMSAERAK